jgi:hypothetical protein
MAPAEVFPVSDGDHGFYVVVVFPIIDGGYQLLVGGFGHRVALLRKVESEEGALLLPVFLVLVEGLFSGEYVGEVFHVCPLLSFIPGNTLSRTVTSFMARRKRAMPPQMESG